MKVLTVFAHNNRRSFCGGVLERFSAGLADAGHTNEVLDLYEIKFDPVFRDRTSPVTPAARYRPTSSSSSIWNNRCCGRAAGRCKGSWQLARCAEDQSQRSPR